MRTNSLNPLVFAGALAAMCGIALPAAAEIAVAEGQSICFGQYYPWDELEAAPGRRVARLDLTFTNWDGHLYFGFDITFQDRWGLVFGGGGGCRERDGAYMCAIDGDGGVLIVVEAEDGGVDVHTDEYGMWLYSAAYDDESTLEEYGEYHPDGIERFRTSDQAMPVHHLVPLPADYCN